MPGEIVRTISPSIYKKYVLVKDVPVLDVGGNISRKTLEEIARNMAKRPPAALVIGHTKEDGEELPTIGFAKNFRVIGDYLYADFYVLKKYISMLDQYPRRSVEFWVKRKIIDPIALLGGSAPARNLPHLVVRYSLFTSYNSGESKQCLKFSLVGGRGMPVDEITEAVQRALRSMPEFQFLTQLYDEWKAVQAEANQAGADKELPLGGEGEEEIKESEAPEEEELPEVGEGAEEEGEGEEEEEKGKGGSKEKKMTGPREEMSSHEEDEEDEDTEKKSLRYEKRRLQRELEMYKLKERGFDTSVLAAVVDSADDMTWTKLVSSLPRTDRVSRKQDRIDRLTSANPVPVAKYSASDIDETTMHKIVRYATERGVSYEEAKRFVLGE